MPSPYVEIEAQRLGILPKTEYRREHFEFQREQSRVMKNCEWEREPVTKGKLLAAFGEFCIGFGIVMGPFCYVVLR